MVRHSSSTECNAESWVASTQILILRIAFSSWMPKGAFRLVRGRYQLAEQIVLVVNAMRVPLDAVERDAAARPNSFVMHARKVYEVRASSRVLTAGVTIHGKATAKVIKKQCEDEFQFVTDMRPINDNNENGIKNAASSPKSGTSPPSLAANRCWRKAKTA